MQLTQTSLVFNISSTSSNKKQNKTKNKECDISNQFQINKVEDSKDYLFVYQSDLCFIFLLTKFTHTTRVFWFLTFSPTVSMREQMW